VEDSNFTLHRLTPRTLSELALELCGGESFAAWKNCLDNLVTRGFRAPILCIIDGNAGLRRAVGLVWPRAAVQRCCVHKLRNLERKAPKHALAEIRDEFHRIVHAANADAARAAYAAFERTWAKHCPGVVTSLREGGDELLTFFAFPKAQWKSPRSTNVIERLHEEFRRRVKMQGSLTGEDVALVLLFSLVASGQTTYIGGPFIDWDARPSRDEIATAHTKSPSSRPTSRPPEASRT